MIWDSDLLDQAQRLLDLSSRGAPREIDMRRAVSAAYYALFHAAVRAVAIHFAGNDWRSDCCYLVYRSVDHKTVRDLCIEVAKPRPRAKLQDFPVGGFSTGIREFGHTLAEMYEHRVRADYDPRAGFDSILFSKSSVQLDLDSSRNAAAQFWAAPEYERKLFATLIGCPPR